MCGKESTEPKNNPPVIESITVSPSEVNTGETCTLTAVAVDQDSDALTYTWSCNYGTFSTTVESSVEWTAPNTPDTYTIESTVSDGKESACKTKDINVIQSTGTVKGYVYQTGTTTPIQDVVISIDSKSYTTGSNGYYELTGIPTGSQTISASKSGYATKSEILIVQTGENTKNIELTLTVTDIDGNTYKTIKIGNQWWMAENLKVIHYQNGDAIPNVTGYSEWSYLSTGAYCNYNNNESNAALYGRLYNWYAVNDDRKIAPEGWHVPTDDDWKKLEMYLGMSQSVTDSTWYRGTYEGGKLKEAGYAHWNSPNSGATNESGFTALPGGYREYIGSGCSNMGDYAYFWSSSEGNSRSAWSRTLRYSHSDVGRIYGNKRYGLSVRCVRDN